MDDKKNAFLLVMIALIFFGLFGCNLPWRAQFRIEITSPQEGQSVVLNQETRVVSSIGSSAGVKSVDLFVNDILEDTVSPPEGSPNEFIADHSWIPLEEGNLTISVVATDAKGNLSDPVTINLQVVPSIGEAGGTITPSPTTTPEGLLLTQTAQAGCSNDAAFLEDITIPPNAYLTAGSNFTKIWRVRNTGTCDWIGYQLVHASGNRLEAASPQALPIISAGSNANLVVDMVAPTALGLYSATWRIGNGDGTLFGPDLSLTIIIPEPTVTPTPSLTPTTMPTKTPSSTHTPSPTRKPSPTRTHSPSFTITSEPSATNTSLPFSVQQVDVQISIAAHKKDHATAYCPSGSTVVSGGFAGQDGLRIWYSMMNGNGWRVFASNTTGPPKQLNVYALCFFNSPGKTNFEHDQMNANANAISHLSVSCPSGTLLTGGGWIIGATKSIQITQSNSSGNGWQIDINNTSDETPPIDVYAICLSDVSGTTTTVNNLAGTIPANDVSHSDVTCPSGTFVTGGGFATNLGVIVNKTSRFGNGWQNDAKNTTNSQKDLTTYAVCYSP